MNHQSNCNWEKSNCEYKETHEYCPHPEHACSCNISDFPDWYTIHEFGLSVFNYYLKKEFEGKTVKISVEEKESK